MSQKLILIKTRILDCLNYMNHKVAVQLSYYDTNKIGTYPETPQNGGFWTELR